MLKCISANGVNGVNGFLCPQLLGETIMRIQAATTSVQSARSTSVASHPSMIIWKRNISIVDAAKTMSKIVGVVRVGLCGAPIKLRSTSCARSARRTLRIKIMLIKYELVMVVQLRSAADVPPAQCSPQAVQPRPGPLGLAWLAGLVGLVLAPSRLGTRRDRSESWTEYGQGHRGCELYLFGYSLHYIGH